MTGAAAFKAARDFLLAHRTDYATAYAQFRWPELPDFNWALDWFDAELAQGASAAGAGAAHHRAGRGGTDLRRTRPTARTASPTACARSAWRAATASC